MREKIKFICAAALATVVPAIMAGSASAAISDIYANGAGSYPVTGTVTSVLNLSTTANTFTVQDNTGSVIVYGIPLSSYTAHVGDSVSFTATNSPYQGAPELTSTGFTLTSATAGSAPPPAILTIPGFKASGNGTTAVPPYAEAIVEIDNVAISPTTAFPGATANATYTLTDSGSNTVSLYAYKSDSAVVAAENAANAANPSGLTGMYDIIGYADEYYGAAEIYPISITTAVPEPMTLGLAAIGGITLLARRRTTH